MYLSNTTVLHLLYRQTQQKCQSELKKVFGGSTRSLVFISYLH